MSSKISIRFDSVALSTANNVISSWPSTSRTLATSLIEKYGPPNEATATMLIWNYNGNWKRTVIHRDGVGHNVPHPHMDILEQTVDAKVDPGSSTDIMKFDGSVIVDRTRGEMTTFCENEDVNTLLHNLAHEILIGKKTAEEARQALFDASDFFHSLLPNQYRDSLLFTSTVEANDPDMVTAQPN